MAFKNLLRRVFRLGPIEAAAAEQIVIDVADKATGGAAGKVIEAAEAIDAEVKRRKRRPFSR